MTDDYTVSSPYRTDSIIFLWKSIIEDDRLEFVPGPGGRSLLATKYSEERWKPKIIIRDFRNFGVIVVTLPFRRGSKTALRVISKLKWSSFYLEISVRVYEVRNVYTVSKGKETLQNFYETPQRHLVETPRYKDLKGPH